MVNKKIYSKKNKNIQVVTKKHPQSSKSRFYIIEIMLFLLFILFLMNSYMRNYHPVPLSTAIIILIIFILIAYYLLTKFRQIKIGKDSVNLIDGNKEVIIPFSEIENISPLMKVDRRDWNFSKYGGITIRKKGEKDRFIATTVKEAELIYSTYLKMVPNALDNEPDVISSELKLLDKRIKRNAISKDYIAVLCISLSIIICAFVFPDYNLRGEYFSLPMKMAMGLIFGLFFAMCMILFYGMVFGTEYEAILISFGMRIELINKIISKNNRELIDIDQFNIKDLKKNISISLKYTGLIMKFMGLIIPVIGLISLLNSEYSAGIYLTVIGSPFFAGLGYVFLLQPEYFYFS